MSYYGGRSRLVRATLQKLQNDEALSQIDHNEWYNYVDLDQLDVGISSKFMRLYEDQETKQFLQASFEKSEWFLTQLLHSLMIPLLKYFMSATSVNGLLKRGSMFVFSVQQFQSLIDYDGNQLGSLLDLGAGDGETTLKMAPCFRNTYATEMSVTMQWRLQEKGFKLLDVNNWDKVIASNDEMAAVQQSGNDTVIDMNEQVLKFDVISCLNLLDRCEKPITFLNKMRNALKPNGRLVVALVLPYKPYVEYNSEHKPKESLFELTTSNNCSSGDDSSQVCQPKSRVTKQVEYLIKNVFDPIGFELVKFSKVPYLCEGNLEQAYFYMIDYVFVFKLK